MNINLTLIMQAVAFFVLHLVFRQVHLAAADAAPSRRARSRSPTASPPASKASRSLASAEKRDRRDARPRRRARAAGDRRHGEKFSAETIEQAKVEAPRRKPIASSPPPRPRSSRKSRAPRNSCATRSPSLRSPARRKILKREVDREGARASCSPQAEARALGKRHGRTHHHRAAVRRSRVRARARQQRAARRGREMLQLASRVVARSRASRVRSTTRSSTRRRRNRCCCRSAATSSTPKAATSCGCWSRRPHRAAAGDPRAVRCAEGRAPTASRRPTIETAFPLDGDAARASSRARSSAASSARIEADRDRESRADRRRAHHRRRQRDRRHGAGNDCRR